MNSRVNSLTCVQAHERFEQTDRADGYMLLSLSNDWVLPLSSDLANAVCERYDQYGTICPLHLRGQAFTTAIVDNIDLYPLPSRATEYLSTAQLFLSLGIQVTPKKAIMWSKLSCGSFRQLKSASNPSPRATPTSQVLCPKATSLLKAQ